MEVDEYFKGPEVCRMVETYLSSRLEMSAIKDEPEEVLFDMDDGYDIVARLLRARDRNRRCNKIAWGDKLYDKTCYRGSDCISVDLGDRRVRPIGYSVCAWEELCQLRTWVVEVSNDGAHWKTIDTQKDHPLVSQEEECEEQKAPRFRIENCSGRWRMIRLRGYAADEAEFAVFGYTSPIEDGE